MGTYEWIGIGAAILAVGWFVYWLKRKTWMAKEERAAIQAKAEKELKPPF